MRKTEFLQELREALDGEVSASVIQSNISYYDQYISQEAAKGRREEEVIEEIGSPRLIAKTIIDSSEGAGETGQGGSYTSGDAAGSGRTASSYNGGFSERDDSGLPPNFHYIDLNKWYWKALMEGDSQRGGYCDLICAVCTGRRYFYHPDSSGGADSSDLADLYSY